MAKAPLEEKIEAEVTPYNFKHPNHLAPEHKSTLSFILEAFAQNAKTKLCTLLKDEVEVSFEGLEQICFEDFSATLKKPSAIGTIDMPPLNGFSILAIQGPVAFTMVNRMLGGDGNLETPDRTFTELEMATLKKAFSSLLQELSNAWSSILKISFSLYETESNPTFVRSIPLRENCLVGNFNLNIGSTKGNFAFCLPYSSIEPITSKLGNQQWQKYSGKMLQEIEDSHKRNFMHMNVSLKAILGSTELTVAELLALETEDILPLDQRAKEPVSISVENTPKFMGHIGLKDKFKGISIVNEITKENGNG